MLGYAHIFPKGRKEDMLQREEQFLRDNYWTPPFLQTNKVLSSCHEANPIGAKPLSDSSNLPNSKEPPAMKKHGNACKRLSLYHYTHNLVGPLPTAATVKEGMQQKETESKAKSTWVGLGFSVTLMVTMTPSSNRRTVTPSSSG